MDIRIYRVRDTAGEILPLFEYLIKAGVFGDKIEDDVVFLAFSEDGTYSLTQQEHDEMMPEGTEEGMELLMFNHINVEV